jgi:4-hydroxy-tetrahydrodipicolinate synthase
MPASRIHPPAPFARDIRTRPSPLRLTGSITALATPFTVTGELDLDAWRRLLQAQIAAGTQALVVAGSTGEAASLYAPEHDALLRTAVECVGGRVPVLAGTGHSGTARTIEATRRAAALGADAALVVVPPYVRPTAAGMLAHYRAVADEGDLPVVMYNVPQRTGCDLTPDAVAELATHPRIAGIKEAVSDPQRLRAWQALRGDGFAVLSGDDATAAQAMLDGADGVVSVVSNLVPSAMRRLCDLALAGQRDDALAWNARLQPLFDFLVLESNPIPVKAVLDRLGIGRGLRLPLTPLSERHQADAARIAALVDTLERSLRDPLAA